MFSDWMILRVNESNGFVSKRIIFKILFYYGMLFGTSYSKTYGKRIQVINSDKVFKGELNGI